MMILLREGRETKLALLVERLLMYIQKTVNNSHLVESHHRLQVMKGSITKRVVNTSITAAMIGMKIYPLKVQIRQMILRYDLL